MDKKDKKIWDDVARQADEDRHPNRFERLKFISRISSGLIFAMFSSWIMYKLITFLFARFPH